MDWIEKLKRLRLGLLGACLAGACLGAGLAGGAELPTPRLESETPQPGQPSLVLLGLKQKSGGETGANYTLSFLGQNTTSQLIERIEVQLLLRARNGRVRSARLFPLEVTLAPGESRLFEKEIHGLSPQSGDVVMLGTSLVPSTSLTLDQVEQLDQPALIKSEFENLERLAGRQSETMQGVLDELRALEARSLKSLEVKTSAASDQEELVVLNDCLIFCLRCAQAAAILCTNGVDSVTWAPIRPAMTHGPQGAVAGCLEGNLKRTLLTPPSAT